MCQNNAYLMLERKHVRLQTGEAGHRFRLKHALYRRLQRLQVTRDLVQKALARFLPKCRLREENEKKKSTQEHHEFIHFLLFTICFYC